MEVWTQWTALFQPGGELLRLWSATVVRLHYKLVPATT